MAVIAPAQAPGTSSSSGDDPEQPEVILMSSNGNMGFAHRVAYAYAENIPHGESLAAFIRAAIFFAAPNVYFRLVVSSMGDFMLVFDTHLDRETLVVESPIAYYKGGTVTLVRSEQADNRFQYEPRNIGDDVLEVDADCLDGDEPRWHVVVSATRFPLEHWNERGITESLRRSIGEVVEVDAGCHDGVDFASVRAVVARRRLNGIPDSVKIANPNGLGSIFKVTVLSFWPREIHHQEPNGQFRFFFDSNRNPKGHAWWCSSVFM